MQKEELERLLPIICQRDTSSDPDNWSEDNPLYGHCAVVALLAQEQPEIGGRILRASLLHTPYARMRSHYVNEIPKKGDQEFEIVDFTKDQFKKGYPPNLHFTKQTREYILSFPQTARRYTLLSKRLHEALISGEN